MGRWEEARREARGSITTKREAVSGVLSAGAGAAVIAAVGHDASAFDVLLGGVAALVVGVILVPGASFFWSAVTYERRQLRVNLTALQDRVGAIEQIQSAAAPGAELLDSLRSLERRGQRIRQQWSGLANEQPPPGYADIVSGWEGDVGEVLAEPRPDLAQEFRSDLGTSALLDALAHPQAARLSRRIDQVKAFIKDVEASGTSGTSP